MRAAIYLIIALVFGGFESKPCLASGAADRHVHSKITAVYGEALTGAGEPRPTPLLLDLYLPSATDGLRPVIVALHGGGFRTGSRDHEEQIEFGEILSKKGYVVASVGYRQHGNAPHVQASFQPYAAAARAADYPPIAGEMSTFGDSLANAVAAAAEDAAKALAWIHGQTEELQIDPERIALLGASAGAITAINLAYLSDDHGVERAPVAAVVAVRGMVIDNRGPQAPSPFKYGEPPLFIVHGTDDDRVSFSEAVRLYDLARAAGVPVELHPFVGYGHELGGDEALALRLDSGELLIDRIDRFLTDAFAGRLGHSSAKCIGAGAACP